MEDWSLNLEITDEVNMEEEGPRDAVRAIKKRLGHKNPKVVALALTVSVCRCICLCLPLSPSLFSLSLSPRTCSLLHFTRLSLSFPPSLLSSPQPLPSFAVLYGSS